MITLEGLRDRLGRVRVRLVERARPAVERLVREIGRTIDLEAWRTALTLRQRLSAVSWPRAGIGAGTLAALVGGLAFVFLYDRPDAYPPPEPTAREIAARREALLKVSRTPPASLVEANRSWKAE